jgi:hypothetical protein
MIDAREALQSLQQIERTESRSAQAHQYANAAPGFVLWGIIWTIGYAGSDLIPRWTGSQQSINGLWTVLTILGIVGSAIIGRRQRMAQHPEAGRANRAMGLRWGASFLALWVFLMATFLVMRPANPMVSGAFVPLIVATVYAIFGIWKGLRFLFAGIAVAALTLIGFFLLPQWFLIWMAAVGGGSLILVGLWLRTV